MSVLDGPGEGTWSVFAAKVMEERDDARRERDEARYELTATKLRVSDLKHALGTDAQGWFDRFKQAQNERDLWERRARAAVASMDVRPHAPGCVQQYAYRCLCNGPSADTDFVEHVEKGEH